MSFLKREHWPATVVINNLLVFAIHKIHRNTQTVTHRYEKVFTNIDPLKCTLRKVRMCFLDLMLG